MRRRHKLAVRSVARKMLCIKIRVFAAQYSILTERLPVDPESTTPTKKFVRLSL
jgi:hypothetical protein